MTMYKRQRNSSTALLQTVVVLILLASIASTVESAKYIGMVKGERLRRQRGLRRNSVQSTRTDHGRDNESSSDGYSVVSHRRKLVIAGDLSRSRTGGFAAADNNPLIGPFEEGEATQVSESPSVTTQHRLASTSPPTNIANEGTFSNWTLTVLNGGRDWTKSPIPTEHPTKGPAYSAPTKASIPSPTTPIVWPTFTPLTIPYTPGPALNPTSSMPSTLPPTTLTGLIVLSAQEAPASTQSGFLSTADEAKQAGKDVVAGVTAVLDPGQPKGDKGGSDKASSGKDSTSGQGVSTGATTTNKGVKGEKKATTGTTDSSAAKGVSNTETASKGVKGDKKATTSTSAPADSTAMGVSNTGTTNQGINGDKKSKITDTVPAESSAQDVSNTAPGVSNTQATNQGGKGGGKSKMGAQAALGSQSSATKSKSAFYSGVSSSVDGASGGGKGGKGGKKGSSEGSALATSGDGSGGKGGGKTSKSVSSGGYDSETVVSPGVQAPLGPTLPPAPQVVSGVEGAEYPPTRGGVRVDCDAIRQGTASTEGANRRSYQAKADWVLTETADFDTVAIEVQQYLQTQVAPVIAGCEIVRTRRRRRRRLQSIATNDMIGNVFFDTPGSFGEGSCIMDQVDRCYATETNVNMYYYGSGEALGGRLLTSLQAATYNVDGLIDVANLKVFDSKGVEVGVNDAGNNGGDSGGTEGGSGSENSNTGQVDHLAGEAETTGVKKQGLIGLSAAALVLATIICIIGCRRRRSQGQAEGKADFESYSSESPGRRNHATILDDQFSRTWPENDDHSASSEEDMVITGFGKEHDDSHYCGLPSCEVCQNASPIQFIKSDLKAPEGLPNDASRHYYVKDTVVL